VPWAASRMMRHRAPLHRVPGLRFARLLGTGHGRSFTPGDADPRHWALLASWDTPERAEAFEHGPLISAWDAHSDERWRLALRTLSSHGLWSGGTPFGLQGNGSTIDAKASPLAVLTRARLAPAKALTFWRAVPPVAAAVATAPGLRFARGIGEAPVGLQATFSVWDDAAAASAFAFGSPEHRTVVDRTPSARWYAEQLFARFAVIEASGRVDGRDPLVMGSGGSEHLG
jgi:hypothetical protein